MSDVPCDSIEKVETWRDLTEGGQINDTGSQKLIRLHDGGGKEREPNWRRVRSISGAAGIDRRAREVCN